MFKRYRAALLVLAAIAVFTLRPAGELTGSAQQAAGTLYEQAKRAGGKLVVRHKPDRGVVYEDLAALARQSDAIVVGRPISNRGRVSADGKSVTQDYRVRVQGVVKGGVAGGETITVSLPGGAYRFPDGTYVNVRPTDYRQATNRRLYVFFLKAAGGVYEPTAQTQALFDLTDGTVEPAHGVATDPVVVKYKGMDAAAFLKELRASAREN